MSTLYYGARTRKLSSHGHISEELMFLQGLTCEENGNIQEATRAEVVHDIKNALTGIRSCAEVLKYEDMDIEDRVSFATTIVAELDRLMNLSQELLNEPSGRQARLHVSEFSVREVLEPLLSVVQCDCKKHHITIRSQLEEPGLCKMDVAKMQRAFMNILTNARDAMPDGGQLTVSLRKVGEQLQLEFSDTGCGMSPELQQRFLQAYVTEGKTHGTGLGMTIVKQVLDRHRAALEVESQQGKGTTIRVLLPCAD